MDKATLLGFIASFIVIGVGITIGGPLAMFYDLTSIFIVVLGSLMVVLMRSSLADFISAGKVAARAFVDRVDKPEELIKQVVELAVLARKGGLIALESVQVDNQLLSTGVSLLADGQDAQRTKLMLVTEAHTSARRQKSGAELFEAWGDFAPALGMIGTLVGLVQMLSNMDDPQSIGPAMAVALLTTLYGAVIANMIAFPIMQKLEQRIEAEEVNNELIIAALEFIVQGGNPRVMESMLSSYLSPAAREALESNRD